ncbi:hypothetical protein BDA99DRAFT_538586 [Phascolomyces articulosus]|uniref:Uncharacterized protein n=1 Tax=Phascolomyces articulosus TaxID=60185 RepID=A0AAD5JY87_9FUNG|nr:hypothetical protein BDA99DRAFT_538586 [Phascolomyces articulosus]
MCLNFVVYLVIQVLKMVSSVLDIELFFVTNKFLTKDFCRSLYIYLMIASTSTTSTATATAEFLPSNDVVFKGIDEYWSVELVVEINDRLLAIIGFRNIIMEEIKLLPLYYYYYYYYVVTVVIVFVDGIAS